MLTSNLYFAAARRDYGPKPPPTARPDPARRRQSAEPVGQDSEPLKRVVVSFICKPLTFVEKAQLMTDINRHVGAWREQYEFKDHGGTIEIGKDTKGNIRILVTVKPENVDSATSMLRTALGAMAKDLGKTFSEIFHIEELPPLRSAPSNALPRPAQPQFSAARGERLIIINTVNGPKTVSESEARQLMQRSGGNPDGDEPDDFWAKLVAKVKQALGLKD